MLKRRIFYCLLFYLSGVVFADSGLELIRADKSIGREIDGEQCTIFSGNVHFRQDTLEMFCQEAVLYENEDKLEFSGEVLIRDGRNRRIRAQRINYDIKSKEARCYSSVKIKTLQDSLYAEFVRYNFKTDFASAEKNIYIYNTANLVQIWGQEGEYNPEMRYSRVRWQARLAKADTASHDTLKISAHRLEYWGGEEAHAVAIDSVLILQGGLKAVCDSALYFTKTELVYLIDRPFAWYEESELNGLRMQAQFDSLDLKQIIVYDEAKALSWVDSLKKEYNELKGKTIIFDIEQDKPKLITAIDNASSIYFLREKDQDQGSNYATSDTIRVFFNAGELDSIQIRGGAEGIFYPSDYQGAKIFETEQQ